MKDQYEKVPRKGDNCATLIVTTAVGLLVGALTGLWRLTIGDEDNRLRFIGIASFVLAIYLTVCYLIFLFIRHTGGLDEFRKK